MPTYQTTKLLLELEEQNQQLLAAVRKWKKTPPEILTFRPATDKWNAIECLDHLNSYGKYYLPAIEKAVSTTPGDKRILPSTFSPGWLGNYFTNLMLPDNQGKVKKMKAPKAHLPHSCLNAPAVMAEFEQQLLQFSALLKKAAKTDLNKARVPVSIMPLIKLKLGDVLRFVIAHNQRHVLQGENAIVSGGNMVPAARHQVMV